MCAPGTLAAIGDDHPRLSRREVLRAGAVAAAGAALATASWPGPAGALPAASRRMVDLTHVLTDGFPGIPGVPSPRRVTVARAEHPPGLYGNEWMFYEHSGTHIDAPAHAKPGGRTVDQIPLEELVMPAVVVDISRRATDDPDAAVGVADLRDVEASVGRIPDGAAVLAYSGWDRRVGDPARFWNFGPDGRTHYPGWSPDAADWLLTNRDVRCIGIDTLSLDVGTSADYPVHRLWLPADRFGLEVIAHLDRLPPIGATLVIAAVPFEKGSGGPSRIFAIT